MLYPNDSAPIPPNHPEMDLEKANIEVRMAYSDVAFLLSVIFIRYDIKAAEPSPPLNESKALAV